MTYEIIGTPVIEAEYSDEWETVMIINVRREDGVEGDVWIVAGVPASERGSSEASRTQRGYERVRVFGDSPSHWCPESLEPEGDDYREVADDIVEAVRAIALETHREAIQRTETPTQGFYGTDDETYYVNARGEMWLLGNGNPRVESLPENAVALPDSVCGDMELPEEAL